jgi:uncharacterized membrane protein YfcA
MHTLDWAGLAATTFAAGLLQAASGFGFAVMAAPLFLFFLGPASAIQLVLILTAALSIFVLPGVWRATDRGLLLRLVLGSLAGLPLGLFAFRRADPAAIRIAIGAAILGCAAGFALLRAGRGGRITGNRALDLAAGAASGVTTALLGLSGPPVVIYLLLGGASPARLRATLLSYFSICYAATIACHAIGVGIANATWVSAGVLIPFACGGGLLGKRLGDRLGPRAFAVLAIALLAATGVYQLTVALAPAPSQSAGHSAADR